MSNAMTTSAPNSDAPSAEPDAGLAPADARELALVHAFLAGDQSALAELLEQYQDRLFGVCLRMMGDADLARDLTQDAMVKVIQGLDRFDGRAKLSTWMIRVTMNVCLTELRRRKVRKHASLDAPVGGTGGSEGAGMTAAASLADERERTTPGRVEHDEDLKRVQVALQRISPDQRALLILRDMQGLEYRQIASLLEVPHGTIKSRLFRARAALREQVERLGSSEQ